MSYYFLDPPYVLLIAGLLAGITSGSAFDATLRQSFQEWSRTRSSRTLVEMQGVALKLPFLGICSGICVFLASGIQIFLYSPTISYGLSLPMTVFIGWLVWTQLARIIVQIEQGGSQAIDLDSWG